LAEHSLAEQSLADMALARRQRAERELGYSGEMVFTRSLWG
jgi:hypothetical protein